MGGFFRLGSNRRAREGRWRAAMRELTVQPTNMDELLQEVVTGIRGNRLILLDTTDWAFPGGPSARWMNFQNIDLVWHDPNLTGTLRDQALGHETGHMIEGHRPAPVDFELVTHAITNSFKCIDPALVAAALERTVFDEDRERDAELFSDWANAWVSRNRARAESRLLTNLRASLESRREHW
jgi:hypothetical protein